MHFKCNGPGPSQNLPTFPCLLCSWHILFYTHAQQQTHTHHRKTQGPALFCSLPHTHWIHSSFATEWEGWSLCVSVCALTLGSYIYVCIGKRHGLKATVVCIMFFGGDYTLSFCRWLPGIWELICAMAVQQKQIRRVRMCAEVFRQLASTTTSVPCPVGLPIPAQCPHS